MLRGLRAARRARLTPTDAWQKSSADWHCGQAPAAPTSRAVARRVVIVAFQDVQALDVTGPDRGVLAWRTARSSSRLRDRPAGAGPSDSGSQVHPRRTARGAAAARSTRSSSPAAAAFANAARDERLMSWLRLRRAALTARHLGLHGSVPARARRAARRPPRDHPLGRVRRAGPRLPGDRGRPRPDLRPRRQRLHVGRRDRRDRSRARARRGGPRAARGARGGAQPGAVRAPPRRPGAVQRHAGGPGRDAAADPRAAGVDRRPPRRGSVGSGARRARVHEPPQLRPRVLARGRRHARRRTSSRVRVERARLLLETTDLQVDEIARALRLRHGRDAPPRVRRAAYA